MSLHRPQTPPPINYAPRPWTEGDDGNLKRCALKCATVNQMVTALRRTEKSIRTRSIAIKLDLSYLDQLKD